MGLNLSHTTGCCESGFSKWDLSLTGRVPPSVCSRLGCAWKVCSLPSDLPSSRGRQLPTSECAVWFWPFRAQDLDEVLTPTPGRETDGGGQHLYVVSEGTRYSFGVREKGISWFLSSFLAMYPRYHLSTILGRWSQILTQKVNKVARSICFLSCQHLYVSMCVRM